MSKTLTSFVLADPRKCIGCKVCEVACAVAHADTQGGLGVRTAGAMDAPILPRLSLVRVPEVTLPVQCRHCEDAPCANACPVGAIAQRGGAIVVDENACMGCKTCMMACPFGAIDLVPVYKDGRPVLQNLQEVVGGVPQVKEKLVARKCDLCFERPGGPACVEACPSQALSVASLHQERRRRNVSAALSLLDSFNRYAG